MPGRCWGAGGCTGAMLRAGSWWMLVSTFSYIHRMLLPGMQGRAWTPCRADGTLTRVIHVAEHRPRSSHQWQTVYLLSSLPTGCLARSEEKSSQGCDATVSACNAARPGYTPHGTWLEGPEQREASMVLAGGTVLQVAAIPPGVLDKAELTDFYCCTRCGKVFWEGSHFGRVVSQFQDVLVTTGDEQSIYELS